MATTAISINGAKRVNMGTGATVLLVDLTIGTSHQQIPFDETELLKIGSTTAMINYIVNQAMQTVAGATRITTLPPGLPEIRSTTAVTGSVAMSAWGVSVRTTTTTPDAFAATDCTIYVDATAGNKVLTLPTAVGITGQRYEAKKTDSSANTVTVTPAGSEKIDAAATCVLSKQGQGITITSDGVGWQAAAVSYGLPANVQVGASAAGIASVTDAAAKAALTAIQAALAAMGVITAPA